MRLTVDASIVVKWFVAEELSGESRLLLAHRLDLHAPDLLLAECANTIWKKARRREIPDSQPYFAELANMSATVSLHAGETLILRAAQLAVEMDHPVYDCVYLACAESTASALVTADQRLADRVAECAPGIEALYIGAPGVASQLDSAATAPIISREKVEELIAAHEVFASTHRHVVDALRQRREAPSPVSLNDLFDNLESPAFVRLRRLIDALNAEERVDIAAIGWLGCFGRVQTEWRDHLEHAGRMAGELNAHYLAGYGQHWRAGYERLTRVTQARERAPVHA